MIINLNEFGGGGGQVSPEEIEKIVNENHYTKEESDEIVDAVRDIADEAKTIAEAKQDELVSGTNIKTINGEDILGEGDIEIKVDAYTKEESDSRYVQKEPVVPSNEIWYWTTDGLTAQTTNETGIASLNTMGLVSNEVVGDKCVMTFSKDVTDIGNCAFYGCSSLTRVTIPDGVTSIGNEAFPFCSSLSSIEIPNGVTSIGGNAFTSCSSLTSVTIPNGVTSIGAGAFSFCPFTSITIPNSVTSIGGNAFNHLQTVGTLYCDEDWFNNLSSTNKTNLGNVANWTKVWIPKSIEERVNVLETNDENFSWYDKTKGGSQALLSDGTIEYNPSVTQGRTDIIAYFDTFSSVASNKFSGCTNLKYFVTNNQYGYHSFGDNAFNGCINLISVLQRPSGNILGNSGYNSIGHYAFKDCRSLKTIDIVWYKASATSSSIIGLKAFENCVSLTTLYLPNNISEIKEGIIDGCHNLRFVYFPTIQSVVDRLSIYYLSHSPACVFYVPNDFIENNKGLVDYPSSITFLPVSFKPKELETDVAQLKEDIKNIELVKSPNVTLFGDWDSFNSGQLKNFSTTKYAQFPFLVDLNNRSYLDSWVWSIDFEITPNSSTSQHNIFDSNYGLAFAIRDGHFVIAYSNDGTTWTRELTGTNTLTTNTTYKVKIGYSYLDGNVDFHVNYSTDGGTTWVNDIIGDGSDVRPYPTQIIIGKALNNSNSFDGIINLNECKLLINGEVKWQGMDDVGLSTRLATDMSNIDAAGVQKVKDIIGGFTLSVLTQAEYENLPEKKNDTLYFITD